MSAPIASATLAELFLSAGERWGTRPAFVTVKRGAQKGSFESVSYHAWCERSLALATALLDLGIAAREHIGLLSDNRFEWILADAAIQFCGAADVPRASDITPAEMTYILTHADVKVVFLENRALLAQLESIREELPLLKRVIVMESSEEALPEGVLSLQLLEERGAALRKAGDRRVEERIKGILPEDLFTIIYTSGTTGTPKGVQLTHRSMCSQIENITFSFSDQERALSLLPIWHSYERVFEMLVVSYGATLYYTTVRHLAVDLIAIKPTIMASAPRLWEALYERMMTHVQKQGALARGMFYCASWSAGAVRQAGRFFKGEELDLFGRSWKTSSSLAFRHAIRWSLGLVPFLLLDRIILQRLRAVVGGAFRATISGGGALPPHIDAFFNDIGIRVFEGYGLTESAPVLAVRSEKNFVLGTVGPLLPKTDLKIRDLVTGETVYPNKASSSLGRGRSGEICVRGPQIMKGYYKDPEGTGRVLRDGWLHTGDIGVVTFNNCLKIIGRCKETIVLRSGENVEPLPLESRLLESPLISQCIVVGQDQKHLGLLIVPSLDGFLEWGLNPTSLTALLEEEGKLKPLIQAEIRRLVSGASGFKAFERIGCWRLLSKPFEVGDELTATYKLKRHVIAERYQEQIEEMFL